MNILSPIRKNKTRGRRRVDRKPAAIDPLAKHETPCSTAQSGCSSEMASKGISKDDSGVRDASVELNYESEFLWPPKEKEACPSKVLGNSIFCRQASAHSEDSSDEEENDYLGIDAVTGPRYIDFEEELSKCSSELLSRDDESTNAKDRTLLTHRAANARGYQRRDSVLSMESVFVDIYDEDEGSDDERTSTKDRTLLTHRAANARGRQYQRRDSVVSVVSVESAFVDIYDEDEGSDDESTNAKDRTLLTHRAANARGHQRRDSVLSVESAFVDIYYEDEGSDDESTNAKDRTLLTHRVANARGGPVGSKR
jgi:hypothetical protein